MKDIYLISKQMADENLDYPFDAIWKVMKEFRNTIDDNFEILKNIINSFMSLYDERHPVFLREDNSYSCDKTKVLLEIITDKIELLIDDGTEEAMKKIDDLFDVFLNDLSEYGAGALKLINPSKDKGFNFQYLLYIPKTIENKTLFIEGNSGDMDIISYGDMVDKNYIIKALKCSQLIQFFSFLNVPCFIPLLPTNDTSKYSGDSDYHERYPRQLSRNSVVNYKDNPLYRTDLQLLKAIEDAKKIIYNEFQIQLNAKSFLYGFSTSGNLAIRLAFLHPEHFCGVCAGGMNAVVPVPIAKRNNVDLIYPVGTYDYSKIMGREFPATIYRELPKLYYIGDHESAEGYNTAVMPILHDKEVRDAFVDGLAKEMYERATIINIIYKKEGFAKDDVIKVIANMGHNPFPMKDEIQKFAKQIIEKENR